MSGKLMKHEFKSTAKVMSAVYLVTIAVTLLEMIVVSFDILKSGEHIIGSFLIVTSTIFYILSIVGTYMVTCIFLTIRFYKTMYSLQGYLTHTLPVSPVATFHIKLFVSLIWMLLTIIVCILSVFSVLCAAGGSEFIGQLASYTWHDIESAFQFTGFSTGGGISLLILYTIACCLSFLLFVFTSCSIGQLFGQYKIAASVVAGIVLNFLQGIISSLSILPVFFYVDFSGKIEASKTAIQISLCSVLGIFAIIIIAYYITNIIIVRKHINLD